MDSKQLWAVERMKYWWTELNFQFQHQLDDILTFPAVRFNRATRAAGWANSFHNVISLSTHFLYREANFDKTIGHECAHVFADKLYNRRCNHDSRWANCMIKIGLQPNRCHSYESAKGRPSTKIIVCPGCNNRLTLGKKIQSQIIFGQTRLCSGCKYKITRDLILGVI